MQIWLCYLNFLCYRYNYFPFVQSSISLLHIEKWGIRNGWFQVQCLMSVSNVYEHCQFPLTLNITRQMYQYAVKANGTHSAEMTSHPCISLSMVHTLLHSNVMSVLHTEHQKKHHFFRATLTKIHIKINHIWTQITYSSPYEAHLKNKITAFVKREKNRWNCKRSFFKNHRNCSPRYLHERPPIHNIQ